MKLRVIVSMVLALGIAVAAQVAADEGATSAETTPAGMAAEDGQSRDSEGGGTSGGTGSTEPAPSPDGQDGDVVVMRPEPEPVPDPDMSPEMEELIAYHAELAARVEAGELTWDEAADLFEERAESLELAGGFGDDPIDGGGDVDGDGQIDEDLEMLLEDFRRELDTQVQNGELSPEEAEHLLIDFMVELELMHVVDGRPVGPADPPPMPPDPVLAIERFHGLLAFLAENEALTAAQVREQVDAFSEYLEDGEEVTLPQPGMNLTMDQAELVYTARDFAMWYDPDEFETARLHDELLHVARALGIIEGGDVVVRPEPHPDPNEEKLLALREDLARQVEDGSLTEEEAKRRYYEAAEELGYVDEDGTVIVVPIPGRPPVEPRPMPPDYEPTPEELEMMELLRELALLVKEGKLTPDEAWERLTSMAVDLGWDIDLGGPDVETPDMGAPEPDADATAAGGVLLTLRSNLASRVQDEDLSSGDAWGELAQAFESQDDAAADGEGTAIQATTWGAVKASMR